MFLDVPYGAVLPPSQTVFFNDLLFNFVDDYVNADDHADGDADELVVQASVLRCHCQLSTASWSRLPLRPSGWFEPVPRTTHQGLWVTGGASVHQEIYGSLDLLSDCLDVN